MDKTLRSILWILVALVILSSFSTGWFFVAKERLYNDYLSLENLFKTSMDKLNKELASSNKKVAELSSKLEAVKQELSGLESKNRILESRYEEAVGERDEMDKELVRVKKAKAYLEKKLKDMESDKFLASLLKERVSLEVELNRLKKTLAPKDMEIERLKKDIADLNNLLSQAKEERSFLESKIKDSTEVAEILSKDLLRERDKNKKERLELENIKIENRILESKLADLKKIATNYDKLLGEREDMRRMVSKLENALENKDEEVENLKLALRDARDNRELRAEAYHAPDEVELPPIVLERDNYGAASITSSPLERISGDRSIRGRIITVNREHDFVVIDLGRQDGIDVGTSFNVFRGAAPIGSIEVIQIRDRIAACDIEYVEEGFHIEINDIVAKR